MRVNKVTILFTLLLIFTFLEVLCNIHFFNANISVNAGYWLNAVYLLCGLVIPLILLIKTPEGGIAERKVNIPVVAIIAVGSCLFIVVMLITGYGIFSKHALDYHDADMLPKIMVMNERWLHHQDVYAPIKEIWNGLLPNYLPSMWLPFLPALILHFDMRMITVASVLFGLVLTIYSIAPRSWNWYSAVALVPFILLVNYNMYSVYFTITEEGLIVGFYILLAFSLIKNNNWLMGIAICLCLLSRFSFLGWLPLFFAVTFLSFPTKKVIQIGLVVFILSLFLMISSQAIYHLRFFANLTKIYSGNLYSPTVIPTNTHLIANSLGLAKFVSYESLRHLQTAMTVITITFPILGWLLYRIMKNIDPQVFLLAMLKLYLVIFYNLMVMPFMYLFFTSTFLSCFILFWYSRNMERGTLSRVSTPGTV